MVMTENRSELALNYILTLLLVLMSPLSFATGLPVSSLPWLSELTKRNVIEFHVCGDSQVRPTKKSLAKHFVTGSTKAGYLLSNLPTMEDYEGVLSDQNLDAAKVELEQKFRQAHLWKYTEGKGFEDLGTPENFDAAFTATIKDCVEGARTTLGADCSKFQGIARRSCCGEKFVGPVITWGKNSEYQLLYSPDPSVRLKVAGEKSHRYCVVQEKLRIRR